MQLLETTSNLQESIQMLHVTRPVLNRKTHARLKRRRPVAGLARVPVNRQRLEDCIVIAYRLFHKVKYAPQRHASIPNRE